MSFPRSPAIEPPIEAFTSAGEQRDGTDVCFPLGSGQGSVVHHKTLASVLKAVETRICFGQDDRNAHICTIKNEGASGYSDENKESQVSGAKCQVGTTFAFEALGTCGGIGGK